MAETTRIAWCDSTFNSWIGCTRVGPGCDNCYAEQQDSRKRWGGTTHWGVGKPRHRTSESYWRQPLAWNRKAAASGKPWRVFCASLADVFDNEVPPDWRTDLWTLIAATPALTWLLLTKRISNVDYPMPSNVWLGATMVNQEEYERDWPKLRARSATKRFISYEPAIGPINFYFQQLVRAESRLPDWVIIGGESGPRARPFDVEWARSTMEQCKAAGVACFLKQFGSCPVSQSDGIAPSYLSVHGDEIFLNRGDRSMDWRRLKHPAGADPSEWPEDLRVREWPDAQKI